VGNVELQEIVTRLGDRFKIERTVPGLVSRLKRRGRSRWREALSLHDLERLFGVDHRAISRTWIDAGLLVGTRRTGRGPHDGWLFTADEVERFIRDCAYAYDAHRMQRGHPLTRLAEVEAAVQRWRTAEQLARYAGVSTSAVRRAVRAGLIAHRRRDGAGKHGEVRIRADDFQSARECLELRTARSRPARTSPCPNASL
jgi:hypothetical protein